MCPAALHPLTSLHISSPPTSSMTPASTALTLRGSAAGAQSTRRAATCPSVHIPSETRSFKRPVLRFCLGARRPRPLTPRPAHSCSNILRLHCRSCSWGALCHPTLFFITTHTVSQLWLSKGVVCFNKCVVLLHMTKYFCPLGQAGDAYNLFLYTHTHKFVLWENVKPGARKKYHTSSLQMLWWLQGISFTFINLYELPADSQHARMCLTHDDHVSHVVTGHYLMLVNYKIVSL